MQRFSLTQPSARHASSCWMLIGTCFLLAAASLHAQQPETDTFSWNRPAEFIPPSTDGVELTFPLFVPVGLNLNKVTVTLDAQYPNLGDLRIYLFSPDGTRTILMQNNCDGTSNLNKITFDQDAANKFGDVCPPSTPLRGREPLTNFNNLNSLGTWLLSVQATRGANSGFLAGFTLTINGTRTTSPAVAFDGVLNTASRMGGSVAPGEILSLYGVGLGPATAMRAVPDGSGNLPQQLGGVSVTFDGNAAPILFASASRIDVQVPYGVAGQPATVAQVSYNSMQAAPVTLTVASSAPGIFTKNPLGDGDVKALNQDGSVNSKSNPAPKGSYVSVFGSGFGVVSPAASTGQVASTTGTASTVSPVVATVGGKSAAVSFSGLAPGQVGVYQINLQIPSNLTSGKHHIVLSTNGQSSQSDAYVYVQ